MGGEAPTLISSYHPVAARRVGRPRIVRLPAYSAIGMKTPVVVHARRPVEVAVRDQAADLAFGVQDLGGCDVLSGQRLP